MGGKLYIHHSTMKRKSSKAQPRNSHSYFQTSLEYVIGEIKFALRVLAVNVDDFSSPASTAKGEWSGHLDNHYSAFGRKKKKILKRNAMEIQNF